MKFHEMKPFVRGVVVRQHAEGERDRVKAADCRLFYVFSGEGTVYLNGAGPMPTRRGTMLLLGPDCAFGFDVKQGTTSVMEISFDYTCDYCNEDMPIPMRPAAAALPVSAHKVPEFEDMPQLNGPLYAENMFEAEAVMNEIMRTFMRKKPNWRIKAGAMLIGLIASLCEKHDELVDNVIDIIEKRYMETLDNGNIASELGYHPNYINAVFRDNMGQTIHQYLLRYRIDTAMQMIITTALPISRIAEKTGFRYFSHFSQCFRHVTGHSPGDYRVKHSSEGC